MMKVNDLIKLGLVSNGLNFDVSVRDLEGEEGINSSETPVLKEKKKGVPNRFMQRCAEFLSDIRLKRRFENFR